MPLQHRLRFLAAVAADDRIQILCEAPSRVAATVADLVDACGPDRPVAVAFGSLS